MCASVYVCFERALKDQKSEQQSPQKAMHSGAQATKTVPDGHHGFFSNSYSIHVEKPSQAPGPEDGMRGTAERVLSRGV